MGWNGVVSPNLSELVRAVRTVEELPTKQKYTALCNWSPNWKADAWGIVCGPRSGKPIEASDKQPAAPLGDGKYHNNIQPSMAAYIWKRTA